MKKLSRRERKGQNKLPEWLKVIIQPSTNYEEMLLYVLYNTIFISLVEKDINRVEDGLEFRNNFYNTRFEPSLTPASVLEVIMGVAYRLSILLHNETHYDETERWFWVLIDNLDLQESPENTEDLILSKVNRFIYREYNKNGKGGLFPLKYNIRNIDQSAADIWTQMNVWIEEVLSEN